MRLELAEPIADGIKLALEPHCEPGRCVIAGSIRRKKSEVGDIEIVCIPLREGEPPTDICGTLFQELDKETLDLKTVACRGFCKEVERWPKIKGDVYRGKYTQRRHPKGINVDIFMVTPENWGLQLAVRTGSAEFSHMRLAGRWSRLGYKSVDGILYRDGKAFPVREERDLFKLLGIEYVEPDQREI